jgi:hypothetical protein
MNKQRAHPCSKWFLKTSRLDPAPVELNLPQGLDSGETPVKLAFFSKTFYIVIKAARVP